MLKWLCLGSALLVVGGCATSKPIQGPNGGIAYFIKCGSAVIDACYEEAAKVCPRGYTFADKQAGQNGMVVPVGKLFRNGSRSKYDVG